MMTLSKKTAWWAAASAAAALLTAVPAFGANGPFQDFLTGTCDPVTGGAIGELSDRCGESDNGDLSGDSESSLVPTQSLGTTAMALAETRARIRALIDGIDEKREAAEEGDPKDPTAMEVFRMGGLSIILQAEGGWRKRQLTELERAYETDSFSLKLGGDYRITDHWLAGVVLGYDRYSQTFAAYIPSGRFPDVPSEGGSDADNISASVFSTKNFGEIFYLEGLVSYITSDYTFERKGIFQESTRTDAFNEEVNTTADTGGTQLAASLGAGLDIPAGPWQLGVYGRYDYQRTTIDSYSEEGGAGFAMSYEEASQTESVGTLGASISITLATGVAVFVPEVFTEYQHAFERETPSSESSFVEDAAATSFPLAGDDPDDSSWRVGGTVLAGMPNGFMVFVGANTELGRGLTDSTRLNGGLRAEF